MTRRTVRNPRDTTPSVVDRAAALEVHRDALHDCTRCQLSGGVRPIVSYAVAPRVMLVGQAPGKVEAAGGKPFAGRAGATLFRWLQRAGIDEPTAREHIYISAITRCYPGPSPGGRGDRVPSGAERARCGDWLDAELRIIRPELLIPVGRLAMDRFLPPRPLNELIGRVHQVEHVGGKCTAVPLPHPSGASSWVHQGDHPLLLESALQLLGDHLVRLRVIKPAAARKSA